MLPARCDGSDYPNGAGGSLFHIAPACCFRLRGGNSRQADVAQPIHSLNRHVSRQSPLQAKPEFSPPWRVGGPYRAPPPPDKIAKHHGRSVARTIGRPIREIGVVRVACARKGEPVRM